MVESSVCWSLPPGQTPLQVLVYANSCANEMKSRPIGYGERQRWTRNRKLNKHENGTGHTHTHTCERSERAWMARHTLQLQYEHIEKRTERNWKNSGSATNEIHTILLDSSKKIWHFSPLDSVKNAKFACSAKWNGFTQCWVLHYKERNKNAATRQCSAFLVVVACGQHYAEPNKK